MEVWREGDCFGHVFAFPKMDLHINKDTFSDPAQYELFEYACQVASENGSPYFVFDRDEVTIAQCCRLRTKIDRTKIDDEYLIKHPESMRFCGFQNVTINLPQASYRAGKGNFEGLLKEIEKAIKLAMKAHIQKKKFITELMSAPHLPLWQIGKNAKDGKPYVDLEKSTYIIGILGLNECVQHLTGKELHEDDEVYKLGLKIIAWMNLKAKEMGKEHNLKVALEESPAESAARRLARIDLREFPVSREVIKGDIENEEYYYTNSIHFRADAPLSLVERIEKQSRFHPLIESGAIMHAFIGEQKPSKESVMNLIDKTFHNTQAAQITVSPEFTMCNGCHRSARGLKDSCSYCGSSNVYGVTRIVGYFSRISNWNKSKIGELKDREKGNYRIN
jgi:ribonucleoside-triphosphate reductase